MHSNSHPHSSTEISSSSFVPSVDESIINEDTILSLAQTKLIEINSKFKPYTQVLQQMKCKTKKTDPKQSQLKTEPSALCSSIPNQQYIKATDISMPDKKYLRVSLEDIKTGSKKVKEVKWKKGKENSIVNGCIPKEKPQKTYSQIYWIKKNREYL